MKVDSHVRWVIRAGTFVDVAPGVVVYQGLDGLVRCEGAVTWAVAAPTGMQALFHRCARNGRAVACILKSHNGAAYVTVDGLGWQWLCADAFGGWPVLIAPEGDGFRIYVMQPGPAGVGGEYLVQDVSISGRLGTPRLMSCPAVADGFLDLGPDGPRLRALAGRRISGLLFPAEAGALTVGQFPDDLGIQGIWQGRRFKLSELAALEPYVAQDGPEAWTAVSRADDNRFVIARWTPPLDMPSDSPIDLPVDPPKPDPQPAPRARPYPPEGWLETEVGADLHQWADRHAEAGAHDAAHAAYVAARAAARMIQDYQAGMAWDAARAKHRADLRRELGLPLR